ncbi:MAG: flagellar biosynthesis anti-sigma factor FlgM [Desulfurella sp.]|uniref:flagellar biosynthesis anti-sigma factor FlgM n=1 Tax=Desulfurella sp. TaxID=1962857 RepID=UPI003CBFB196
MKISDILGSSIDSILNHKKIQKNTQIQTTQTTDSKNSNTVQDSINISKTAKILSNLSDLEANHQKRLEAVQKAYENGTYNPDLTNLAKSILEEIKNG